MPEAAAAAPQADAASGGFEPTVENRSPLAAAGDAPRDPTGPDAAFDPDEPGVKKRVQRGGSYLCTDQYCSRYMIGTRGKGEETTGTNHLGFRCVRPATGDAPAPGATVAVGAG